MQTKKIFFFLILFLQSSLLFSQVVYTIDSSNTEVSLSNYSYHFKDSSNIKLVNEVITEKWQTIESPITFPSNKNVQWIKYNIINPYNVDLKRFIYIPYHFIHEIDVYLVVNSDIQPVIKTGIKRSYYNKHMYSRGYPVKVVFKANSTSEVLIKYTHIYRPLRASAFLMTTSKIEKVNRRSEHIIWFWRGLFVFALIISFSLFIFVKLKIFLYYFFLNIGVGVFIASHIGDYFLLFNIDSSDITGLLDYTGAIIMNFFLPLFLNSLTPIKKRNRTIWKVIYWINYGMIFFWILTLFPSIRMSIVNYYAHFYIMIGSLLVLGIQPYLLAKAIYYKDRNAVPLFIIYSLYISSAFIDVILPNMGLLNDTPFVYDNLLLSSFIEIFSFMFIMAKETLSIYDDRQKLLSIQQTRQKQMLTAIVKSQEDERNKVGRELHDALGANMAMIKQHISKNNEPLYSIVSQSIKTIRNLSHGLVTPNVKNEEFIDEIKDLCHKFNSDKCTIHHYFYMWPKISDTNITTHLYRITQELLQNASKHSQAKNVFIQFISDEKNNLSLIYEDDGIGFEPSKIENKGLGLRNIHNRIELLNGSLRIDASEQSKGTTIIIEVNII